MKSVLLSTRPKWCEKICHEIGTDKNGKPIYEKKIEVRKTKPSIPTPFKVYVYCTKTKNKWSLCDYEGAYQNSDGEIVYAQQHVIGEFICDKIEEFSVGSLRSDDIENLACLSYNEMIDYFYKPEELDGKTAKHGYAWHISELKIYDKPKELSEFFARCHIPESKCKCCDNCFEREDSYGRYYAVKKLTRPPQSYMYVEEV